MTWIAEPEKLDAKYLESPAARTLLGGKGANLARLAAWGMNVPRFGVLTTAFHRAARESKSPIELVRETLGGLSSWDCENFAVRGSLPAAEDGVIPATFLNVRAEDVPSRVLDVHRSADSTRARMYRSRREGQTGADVDRGPAVAVVIQKMIAADASGMAFSRAPTGNSALVRVEAGWGLGEDVISGKVDVDTYLFDRFGAEIRREVKNHRPSLPDETLSPLLAAVIEIERRLGHPTAVEFAVTGRTIHVIHARPIAQPMHELHFYADTGLAGNYPGLTSPMTADFVARMYAKAFSESAEFLGASSERVLALMPFYRTLIRSFGGHLYFHLNSYFAVIAAIPFGKKRLEAWHRLVGESVSRAIPLHPLAPPSLLERLRFAVHAAAIALFHRPLFARFTFAADSRVYKLEMELKSLETTDAKQTIRLLLAVIGATRGWGLPIVNELMVRTGTRRLAEFLAAKGVCETDTAVFLGARAGVDTLGPLRALDELAGEVARETSQEPERVHAFLDRYGGLGFEELKLECPTFKEDPEAFSTLLHWKMRLNAAIPADTGAKPAVKNPVAELAGQLTFQEKIRFRLLAWFTENAVRARIATHATRGRFISWVRRAALQAFRALQRDHAELFSRYKIDEFWGLTLSDLHRYALGAIDERELEAALSSKARWRELEAAYPEFYCHPEPYPSAIAPYFRERNTAVRSSELNGTGARPGIARGKVLALTHPTEVFTQSDLHERILVTRSTDPAWIFVLSKCAGLISEKGGLLSHTAIIGRELGIPTVVGATKAMSSLRTGDWVELNGASGVVRRIEPLRP